MSEIDHVKLFGTTYMLKDAQARNDNGILDKYGALNRTPWVNGQAWTSTLKVTCQNGVYTANGTLTGNAETHYNIFSNTDSLPNGISPGMKLQVTHECESTNVTFRIYNRVNDTNVLLCEIPGNGTKIVTVDENATGMIVRLSYLNGVTYTNMVSKPFIFGTLAKQSIESRFEEDENALAETLDPNPTKNLFNKYTITNNLLINANGEEEASGLYMTSDYIKLPVKAVMISSVGSVSRPYIYRIAIYNKNKVWQYRQVASTDDFLMTVNTTVIPTTDEYYYIRISFEVARETDFDTVQVEVGAQKTAYVPHLMPLDWNGRELIDNLSQSTFFAKGESKSGLAVSYRTGVISVNGTKSDTQALFFTVQPEGARYASRMIMPTGDHGGTPKIPLKQGHKYALRGTFTRPTASLIYGLYLAYKNAATDETWQKIEIHSSTSSAPTETPTITFDHMGKLFLGVTATTDTAVNDTINFVLEDITEV